MKTPEQPQQQEQQQQQDIEATLGALRALVVEAYKYHLPSTFQAFWELVHTLPADYVQSFYVGLAQGYQEYQDGQQQKEV